MLVAPAIASPSRLHCEKNGVLPSTTGAKVTFIPRKAWRDVLNVEARNGGESTTSAAFELVALPTAFRTSTLIKPLK